MLLAFFVSLTNFSRRRSSKYLYGLCGSYFRQRRFRKVPIGLLTFQM
jgi:hypothetical protein